MAGFGCVISDHNHKIVKVIYGPLGICNAVQAEAYSVLMDLRELYRLQLKGCEVEGDSSMVISCLGMSVGSCELAPVIYEIREIVSSLSLSLLHFFFL